MTQTSCKRADSKSKNYPGMKLVPVRVFSCKHPLTFLFQVDPSDLAPCRVTQISESGKFF